MQAFMQTAGNIVQIHSNTPLLGNERPLTDGQSVFVRVLKDSGGGFYEASFAGGRFNVQSKIPLFAGDTFRATVTVQGGRLVLTPAGAEGSAALGRGILVQNFGALSPEVSAFLAAVGLPADEAGARIIQFMMQNGKKLDFPLMQKAHRLARKYKGREADAAETLLVLEEKGMDAETALDALMEEDSGGEGKNEEGGRGDSDAGENGGDAGAFEDGAEAGGPDVLSVFNSLAEKKGGPAAGKKGWLMIPFEWTGGNSAPLTGDIRLFCDYEQKITEKLIINLKNAGKNLKFALYFKEKKVFRISFACGFKADFSALKRAFGGSVELCECPAEGLSAFGTEDLPLSSVEGFA